MSIRSMTNALNDLGANRAEILATTALAQPPPARAAARAPKKPAARDEMPGLGRYIAIAAVASVAFVWAVGAAALLATGSTLATAVGIGGFAAVWGGGGFGAMIGGVLYVHRFEEPERIPSLVGSELDRTPELLPPWPTSTPVPGRR